VISQLSFFEQAPINYDWINGASGGNNYPTLFGLRVTRDGVEIFQDPAIPTENVWHKLTYDFAGVEGFVTDTAATYRFEFLPYCLIGNDSTESAWDIDHVEIFANCGSTSLLNPFLGGSVKTLSGVPVSGVQMNLSYPIIGQIRATSYTDET